MVCLLILLFAPAKSSRAAELTLTRNGQPSAEIVISATPSAQEQLAATELQTYLRKISGATLPVSNAATGAERTAVLIGVYGAAPVAEWRGERPGPDGFVIETRGNVIRVIGGDTRGALYGVYDLLEIIGVRWFMPGEMGEDVPARQTVTLAPVERRSAPAFRAVSGLIWAGGPGAYDWERRIRASVGPPNSFFGHNWANIIPPTPENKAAHPEWFALHDGKRIDQLCSTNPDVIRITVEKAREFFDQNPEALTFSISPNDGEEFCECDRCRALDRQYGVTDGTLTDRFVHYANQVLAELAKTHPTKQVGLLAYVQHTRPPVSARPHPNLATIICHTPWEFCHVHALDDPNCTRNRRFMEYVTGWAKLCKHVGVYDYYGHFYAFTPWPIVHDIRRDIPLLARIGVERFMSETQQHWANQGINFYLAAKLLWNPREDTDRLLAEYYDRFYGKASAPMRKYWERWEQAMIETAKLGDGGYKWFEMFTPGLVSECNAYLTEAERLAATDREVVRRRLAFIRKGFRFTEAWTKLRYHGERGEYKEAVAAGEEALKRIDETTDSEPQAFFIWLAKSQTEKIIEPYRRALARQSGAAEGQAKP
ncbi:MAG TPA: DUF4838 domain-containing protein [Pyrinomonadaceae bacterium]|jgi:hypothetical protein